MKQQVLLCLLLKQIHKNLHIQVRFYAIMYFKWRGQTILKGNNIKYMNGAYWDKAISYIKVLKKL